MRKILNRAERAVGIYVRRQPAALMPAELGGPPLRRVSRLKRAYQILFRSKTSLADALREMEQMDDEHVRHLANFIRHSRRGLTRSEKRGTDDDAEAAPIIYDGKV